MRLVADRGVLNLGRDEGACLQLKVVCPGLVVIDGIGAFETKQSQACELQASQWIVPLIAT